jgi:hypothetical protein
MGGYGCEYDLFKGGYASIDENPSIETLRAEIAIRNDEKAQPVWEFVRDSVFPVLDNSNN